MKYAPYYNYKVFFSIFVFLVSGIFMAFGLDIDPQFVTSSGSNNSHIYFSTGGTASGTTSYINKDNDSDTIGNYFQGYYYDTQFGFFKLDWNTGDTSQNVHVVSTTDKCSGVGYKFAGYAQSDSAGYIKFDHDATNFVYYCTSDKKLHGWAYSEHLGFQSFEGITFEIIALADNPQSLTSTSDPFFVNNKSLILMNFPTTSNSLTGTTTTIQ